MVKPLDLTTLHCGPTRTLTPSATSSLPRLRLIKHVFARARNQHNQLSYKPGNEQRNYVKFRLYCDIKIARKVNKVLYFPFLQRQHIPTYRFLKFLMFSSRERRGKTRQYF